MNSKLTILLSLPALLMSCTPSHAQRKTGGMNSSMNNGTRSALIAKIQAHLLKVTPRSPAWIKKFSNTNKQFTRSWTARFSGNPGQKAIATFLTYAHEMKHFRPYHLAAFTVGDDSLDLGSARTPEFTQLLLVDQGRTAVEVPGKAWHDAYREQHPIDVDTMGTKEHLELMTEICALSLAGGDKQFTSVKKLATRKYHFTFFERKGNGPGREGGGTISFTKSGGFKSVQDNSGERWF